LLFVIGGFIIIVLCLYIAPKKEAEYTMYKIGSKRNTYIWVGLMGITVIVYIPFICGILLDGMVVNGYLYSNEGGSAAYFLALSSLILIITCYKIYTFRLKIEKERISNDKFYN
jgi:hypothetical protein